MYAKREKKVVFHLIYVKINIIFFFYVFLQKPGHQSSFALPKTEKKRFLKKQLLVLNI